MIYLIGGPPKCGKTKNETYSLNTPRQIAKNYIKQSNATYQAIDMFSICEITDGNDYIIEGYHVTPQLANRLIKKYGRKHFHVLFLIKSDVEKFIHDVKKSSTSNDWILAKTKQPKTLHKIAEMICYYGKSTSRDTQKYGFKILNMDNDFNEQIKKAKSLMSRNNTH